MQVKSTVDHLPRSSREDFRTLWRCGVVPASARGRRIRNRQGALESCGKAGHPPGRVESRLTAQSRRTRHFWSWSRLSQYCWDDCAFFACRHGLQFRGVRNSMRAKNSWSRTEWRNSKEHCWQRSHKSSIEFPRSSSLRFIKPLSFSAFANLSEWRSANFIVSRIASHAYLRNFWISAAFTRILACQASTWVSDHTKYRVW